MPPLDDESSRNAFLSLGLGQKLTQLRDTHQMTMSQLAEASGVSLSMVSAIERDRTIPGLETLLKIASSTFRSDAMHSPNSLNRLQVYVFFQRDTRRHAPAST